MSEPTHPPKRRPVSGQTSVHMDRLDVPNDVRYHCAQHGVDQHSWQIADGPMPVYLTGTSDELRRLASRLLYLAELRPTPEWALPS